MAPLQDLSLDPDQKSITLHATAYIVAVVGVAPVPVPVVAHLSRL